METDLDNKLVDNNLVSKESIGNCRSSSDFNDNLMKIVKKLKRTRWPPGRHFE